MRYLLQLAGVMALLAGSSCAAQRARDASLDALRARAEDRGYRVREVRWDPVLRQRWAVLESVDHPERPYRAELTETSAAQVTAELRRTAEALSSSTQPPAAAIAIHAGDQVTVWRSEPNLRMQMAAVADGNAAVGDRVTLRVKGAGVNGEAGFPVTGIVRGPGSVEME